MDKVFAVLTGDGQGYSIRGLFKSEEDAQQLESQLNKVEDFKCHWVDEFEVK